MAARQRLQDIRRGPLVVEGGVGWRHWLLTSPSQSWPMGYRTATLRTLTPVPNRVGADSIMLTATFGCQNAARTLNTFSATVWTPPHAGPREQERYAREAEVRFLRGKWQISYRPPLSVKPLRAGSLQQGPAPVPRLCGHLFSTHPFCSPYRLWGKGVPQRPWPPQR